MNLDAILSAGIVVGRLGTATASPEEIRKYAESVRASA